MHARIRTGCGIVLLAATITASERCPAQEKRATPPDRDSVLVAARDIMGQQKYCALITVDSTGQPHARTMNPFPPEEDMTVWIATNSRSRKAHEIEKNPRVCLYYANHGQATGYVAITGRAVLVDDMAEKQKRKRDYWDQAFPDWKYLLLIKVIPERIEVINYRHGMLNDPVTWSAPSVQMSKP
ncbi:MAG TPA: pyridoxamine 5'-phosphate oxidase family protein [Bacteroidota bacterium]|nr:pyridoxamine 5'-phosphate oxidase family protein [Bacteroidota bacterium]